VLSVGRDFLLPSRSRFQAPLSIDFDLAGSRLGWLVLLSLGSLPTIEIELIRY